MNEHVQSLFKKEVYSEIKEVIMEKMKFLLGTIVPQQDQAVFAAHPANLPFLQELGFGVKKFCLFMENASPCLQMIPYFIFA